MTYKLPPLPDLPPAEVEEWSESGITFRGEGWKKETVEKYATAYAIAAIKAQCVPDKTGTAYADLHAKWRKGRQELANLTRAHERLKVQSVPDGWRELLKAIEWGAGGYNRFGDSESMCPYCESWQSDGHANNCLLSAALASSTPAPQAKPQPLSSDRDARIAELERELEKEKQYVKEMTKDRDHWMTVAAERALLLDKNRKVNKPLSDYEFDEID